MKKLILLLTLSFSIMLTMNSCQSTDEAKEFSDSFFTLVVNEEYEKAIDKLEYGASENPEAIKSLVEFGNHPDYGKLIKAEKNFGFNTSIKNGTTTVILPYELSFENGSYNVQVTVVDRGNGYQIYSVE